MGLENWLKERHEQKMAKAAALRTMALAGDPKPKLGTPLGNALRSYSYAKSLAYIPEFDQEVRNLRPDWFTRPPRQERPRPSRAVDPSIREARRTRMKARHDLICRSILEIAKAGDDRPSIATYLGRCLNQFTCLTAKQYDAAFDAELRKARPDWFGRGRPRGTTGPQIPPEDAKNDLIQRALRREHIRIGHPMYMRLRHYTRPTARNYDAEFAKVIMLLAPDWSVKSDGRVGEADANKKAILLAAEAGWAKPSRQTKMGQVLSTYVSVKHDRHDDAFTARLMALRPDWFRTAPTKTPA